MSDDSGDGVWFRRTSWGVGYHFIPVTWQGWAAILVFFVALFGTTLLGDPSTAKPQSLGIFLEMKAMFRLSGAHLSRLAMMAAILVEIGLFLVFIQWKSRPVRPLD